MDFAERRDRMVRRQIAGRGIGDPAILAAFREVPRELFVDEAYRQSAYDDHPLPIAAGQTISQPFIVAMMIAAAAVKPSDTVLEVGAGSGYAAAIMSRIAARVIGIERQPELVQAARKRMRCLGYENVEIVEGDGTLGWPEAAPYDAILAAASGSHVPRPLIAQLAAGGRLVMPVGGAGAVQKLVQLSKSSDGSLAQSDLGEVRFVPLIGQEGWSDS